MKKPGSQRGMALIVGLIMLVLITLVVMSAFRLSSSNLKLVGNVQVRNEAIAATNRALEQVISSEFYTTGAQTVTVDVDKDGTIDYTIAVAAPTCTKAWVVAAADPSDVELGPGMSSTSIWNTEWELDASAAGTGSASSASVRVREGVRVALPEAQKNLYCP